MSTLRQRLRDHYRRYLEARHLLSYGSEVSYTVRQGSGLLPANCSGSALDAYLEDRLTSSPVVLRDEYPFSPASAVLSKVHREPFTKRLATLLMQIYALHDYHKRN